MKKDNYKNFTLSILIYFIFLLFLLIVFAIINPVKLYTKIIQDQNYLILNYQMQKIKNSSGINSIFLGDSSLGNSINTDLFTELSNQKTLNLSLTKIYGFAGQFNLLKKANRNSNNDIKNVYLMISYDFLDIDLDDKAYFITQNNFFDILDARSKTKFIIEYFKFSFKLFFEFFNKNEVEYEEYLSKNIKNDFIIQNERDIYKYNLSKKINPYIDSKKFFLKKIEEYSVKHNLNLVILNGPVLDTIYYDNPKAISEFDNFFTNNINYNYYNERVLLKYNDVGNYPMHVKYSMKNTITKKYFDLIK